ncbi:tetraprenyl-beta-curcumene synthase family protein [Jeotgalibacillus sp. R-1-5s-1]|uniref:tetraprenyl-beta-curcumene synthase family protein n=1 Tax=Jeotgalibacillus sp. R-1-5s-1 TaxID=2555897 RepID=UPI00106A9A53|nr:tetraprenyl-beta-curcumene synthase family protein [Jeotgalibacillus sp. R-1-5s-1]TFD98161.1 tetraprenyl-beta-curcumene synthase family protein [Jeotgalibacillus sp. R-1-5s-1]
MAIPNEPLFLMNQVYRKVFPIVHRELAYWKEKAVHIDNEELRKQALDSLHDKTFHCEGGGIMGLLALHGKRDAIEFIVAYQTISDYLDNLCDRSTSLDPEDFACLHRAMEDALTVGAVPGNYYECREDQEPSYLTSLVMRCQDVLSRIPNYPLIKDELLHLSRLYCDLQIHKHVQENEREHRLQQWFNDHRKDFPGMEWYEFSACTGSTLGIFCLVSYSLRPDFKKEHAKMIQEGYFPYIQGLHILLDYFIDQEEDRAEGDLNFCFYYPDHNALFNRLQHFVKQADIHTGKLPHSRFHKLINRGLLGVYLSDEKVHSQVEVKKLAWKMIRSSGPVSFFFYLNGRAYRNVSKMFSGNTIAKKTI